jgi:hypothetical protein
MQYQSFLQEVQTAQLHEGRDGVRLVGEGLLVPHPAWADSREWEKAFRDKSGMPSPWNKA